MGFCYRRSLPGQCAKQNVRGGRNIENAEADGLPHFILHIRTLKCHGFDKNIKLYVVQWVKKYMKKAQDAPKKLKSQLAQKKKQNRQKTSFLRTVVFHRKTYFPLLFLKEGKGQQKDGLSNFISCAFLLGLLAREDEVDIMSTIIGTIY